MKRSAFLSSRWLCVAGLVWAVTAGSALPAVTSFTGNGDGTDWFDPDNWDAGVPSDLGNSARIPLGFTVLISGGDATVDNGSPVDLRVNGTLTIDDDGSLTVEISGVTDIDNGTVNVMGDFDARGALTLASIDDSSGTMNVSGGGSVSTSDTFRIGDNDNATGILEFHSTGSLTVGDDMVIAGRQATAVGTVSITGGGSVDVNDLLYVAGTGDGAWTQSGGTLNVGGEIRIGFGPSATGEMTFSGGTIVNAGNGNVTIRFGTNGGAGTLNHENAIVTVTGGVDLSGGGDSNTSIYNLSGGSLVVSEHLFLGTTTPNGSPDIFHVVGSDPTQISFAGDLAMTSDGVLWMTMDAGGVTPIQIGDDATLDGTLRISAHTDPGMIDIVLVNLTDSSSSFAGQFDLVQATGVYSGADGSTLVLLGDDGSFKYRYQLKYDYNGDGDSNDLALVFIEVVPEPTSAGLLVGSSLLWARRRRRNAI